MYWTMSVTYVLVGHSLADDRQRFRAKVFGQGRRRLNKQAVEPQNRRMVQVRRQDPAPGGNISNNTLTIHLEELT